MGTIAEKLAYLAETKDKIREAIVATGVEVPEGTTFRGFAELITGGSGGGTGNGVRVTGLDVSSDGTYTIMFEDFTELYGIVDFDINGKPTALIDTNNATVEFSNGWPTGITLPDGHAVTIKGM